MLECQSLSGRVLQAHLLEDAEEDVGVEGALVGLVHDDGAVVVQVPLAQGLPQQHAVRHVLYHRLLARAVLKADCVAHLRPSSLGLAVRACCGLLLLQCKPAGAL